jgi:hypothetical protein
VAPDSDARRDSVGATLRPTRSTDVARCAGQDHRRSRRSRAECLGRDLTRWQVRARRSVERARAAGERNGPAHRPGNRHGNQPLHQCSGVGLSPDGLRMVFTLFSLGLGGAPTPTLAAVDGRVPPRPVAEIGRQAHATHWSRDGRFIVGSASHADTTWDIWVAHAEGRAPLRYLTREPFQRREPRISRTDDGWPTRRAMPGAPGISTCDHSPTAHSCSAEGHARQCRQSRRRGHRITKLPAIAYRSRSFSPARLVRDAARMKRERRA